VAAIRRDAVDEDDDAFAPLLDVDVLGMGAGFDLRLCSSFGFVDRLSIGIRLDCEAVIGAQPGRK